MDLPLIEAVKSNPCLYNKRSLTYRNRLRREVAWLEVASSVGVNVEIVQSRWKALRDRYVKELTKVSKNSSKKNEMKWKLAAKMSFLRLHLKTIPKTDKEQSDNELDDEIESIEDAEILAEDAADCDYAQDPLLSNPKTKQCPTASQPTPPAAAALINASTKCQSNAVGYTENGSAYVDEEHIEMLNSEQHSTIVDLSELVEMSAEDDLQPQSNAFANDNMPDRITSLVDAVTHLITNQVKRDEDKSRNSDFLKVLDTYLLRLPDGIQDELKIEMLNLVFNKQKQLSQSL